MPASRSWDGLIPELRRAPDGGDLVSLPREGRDPFIDGRSRLGTVRSAAPKVDARDLEQSAQLTIGQLNEQVGEKFSSRFADFRITQRPGEGLAHVRRARRCIAPDRRPGPFLVVDAAFGAVI